MTTKESVLSKYKKRTSDRGFDSQIDKRLISMAKAQGSRKRLSAGKKSAAKRKSLATYQRFRNQLDAKAFIGTTGNFIEETIILDIGGRYSKIGFVGEPCPRRICKTHLRLGDYRKSCPYVSQKFKAGVPLLPVVLSLSKKPLSIQTWQEIAELLVDDLLFNQLEIKPDKRRIILLQDAWWPTPFQNSLARAFFRHQCPGVQFVDSLHTALFSTGKSSGIVLDVGYHTSKIQATVHGHILPETRDWKYVGFYSIMQEFKKLMRELAKLDFNEFRVSDEQIEKAISRTCFVQPLSMKNNPPSKVRKGTELVPNSVSFEFNVKKQSAFCKITPSIRRRICDVLFDAKRTNIVHFLCDALLSAPIDCRGILINHILLTGGTCQLPGFEARFIQEFKLAMSLPQYSILRNMQHRFRLLKSDIPANIRMFSGASVYGDLTSRFVEELFITRKQFESAHVKERIYDWTETHQMSEELLSLCRAYETDIGGNSGILMSAEEANSVSEVLTDKQSTDAQLTPNTMYGLNDGQPPVYYTVAGAEIIIDEMDVRERARSTSSGRSNSVMDIATLNALKNANSYALPKILLPESGLGKKPEVDNPRPITNITHAEIVRKPQYRGRPTHNLAQNFQKSSGYTTPRKTVDITQRISSGKRRSMDVMPRSAFDRAFPETERALASFTPSTSSHSKGIHIPHDIDFVSSKTGDIVVNLNTNVGKSGVSFDGIEIETPDIKYDKIRKTMKVKFIAGLSERSDESDAFSSRMSSHNELGQVDIVARSASMGGALGVATRTPVGQGLVSGTLEDSGILAEGDEEED